MFGKSSSSMRSTGSLGKKKKKKSPEASRKEVVNSGDDLIDIRSSLGGNSDFERAVESSKGSTIKN